jgi:adenylylsulfate kinase-like enzyme
VGSKNPKSDPQGKPAVDAKSEAAGMKISVLPVNPCRSTRNERRNSLREDHLIEIFPDTPIEICERLRHRALSG